MRVLMDTGRKQEAYPLMREFKKEMADFEQICAENPGLKENIEKEEQEPAPIKQV